MIERLNEKPDNLDTETWKKLKLMMWQRELNATVGNSQKPDWHRRRAAGAEICALLGLTDAVMALRDRPAPKWPEVDIIPHGGSAGRVDCLVRSVMPEIGFQTVVIGIPFKAKTKTGEKHVEPEAIAEARERGKFELRKKLR